MILFGLVLVVGNGIGGRFADRSLFGTLFVTFAAQAAVLFVFWLGVGSPAVASVSVFLMAAFGFATVSPIQKLVMDRASRAGAPTIADIRAVPVSYNDEKARIRSETFVDHYSQARQLYIRQTEDEQKHMADALAFELSKVKTKAIRLQMLLHLLNIHEDLARAVATGLGIKDMPAPAASAVTPRTDLPESPALPILKNGPDSFADRKIGILLTEDSDAAEVKAIVDAAQAEGAPLAIFDAVAILPSAGQGAMLAAMPAATTWAHYKVAAHNDAAKTLFAKAGLPKDLDDGFLPASDAKGFITACRQLRVWDRQMAA